MIRLVRVLTTVCVLAAASRASAACRWFGTQLECDLGASRVVIGTQAADRPTGAGASQPQAFQDGDGLLDVRAILGLPFELKLQDIGTDPSLCRRIGNETYCY